MSRYKDIPWSQGLAPRTGRDGGADIQGLWAMEFGVQRDYLPGQHRR
ncbi:hypothetical protein LGH82_32345 [Mesorhizobium sp. PAMC28654]|nr:hypothetical protein [Mesorhizobium sp. PAMC28654]UDL89683.1 hypothetical protein LGH82_32345 [Mesorhizobium sp. PAMC28654]